MNWVSNFARALYRRASVLVLLVGLWWPARAATAAPRLDFHGGPIKNYVVDLIFYGSDFTDQDRQDALDYLLFFASYLNGSNSPFGTEPAAHYYGVSGIMLGLQISDNVTPGLFFSDSDGAAVAQGARNGGSTFGNALDYWGSYVSTGLPSSQNRLPVILTKGVPTVYDSHCGNPITQSCPTAWGFHDADSNGFPYAVVQFDHLNGLSHEIIEAMTDPYAYGSSAWTTDEGFGEFSHQEVCDICSSMDFSSPWQSSTGHDISGISELTLNPSYGGFNNIAAGSCQVWEPEQYAPIAATVGWGLSTGAVTLAYRTPDGRVEELLGGGGRIDVDGPIDLGHPDTYVVAQGKPTIVSFNARVGGSGTYVFVRGSDDGLWMYYDNGSGGSWTNLGGRFFGDPSAVVWDGGQNVNVFVLGTDSNIYTYGIQQGALFGWLQVPSDTANGQHVFFSGSPKAISRPSGGEPGRTIDLLAVGQAGGLFAIAFSTNAGWSSAISVQSETNIPVHTPVGIAAWGEKWLEVLRTTEFDTVDVWWNGGSWINSDQNSISGAIGSNEPSGTPAIVSSGGGTTGDFSTYRMDAFLVDRQNRLLHAYASGGSWHADPSNPLAQDAVGDPVAVSPSEGEVHVFYRTQSGSITHGMYQGGTWTWRSNIVPENGDDSVQ